MKPVVQNEAPKGPNQPTRRPQIEIPSSFVFGFPVSVNPFQFLQESTSAVSHSSVQIEGKLIDPRSTRLSRQQATRRFEDQETLGTFANEGILHTVPLVQDVQGTLTSRGIDQPIASKIPHKFFPHS